MHWFRRLFAPGFHWLAAVGVVALIAAIAVQEDYWMRIVLFTACLALYVAAMFFYGRKLSKKTR